MFLLLLMLLLLLPINDAFGIRRYQCNYAVETDAAFLLVAGQTDGRLTSWGVSTVIQLKSRRALKLNPRHEASCPAKCRLKSAFRSLALGFGNCTISTEPLSLLTFRNETIVASFHLQLYLDGVIFILAHVVRLSSLLNAYFTLLPLANGSMIAGQAEQFKKFQLNLATRLHSTHLELRRVFFLNSSDSRALHLARRQFILFFFPGLPDITLRH